MRPPADNVSPPPAPPPTQPGFWALVRSDAKVWADLFGAAGRARPRKIGPFRALGMACAYPGLRATLLYRMSHAAYRARIPGLPQFLSSLNVTLHGLDIIPGVRIGPHLYIPHPIGTVVTAHAIGARCTLVSGITIGLRNGDFPTLGDDVYVGAGARILGGIRIGNGAKVGANAVVLTDVPDGFVAVGVPAKVIPPKTPEPPIE